MITTTAQRRSAPCRRGFSLAEVTVVVMMVGILAAIALPSYQKVTYRARAASIVGDFQAVRTAAYQYEADHGAWPDDLLPGEYPEELDPYIDGIEFTGPGYQLDWENWDMSEGKVIGISAALEDELLESALLALLSNSGNRYYRFEHHYTFLIEAPW